MFHFINKSIKEERKGMTMSEITKYIGLCSSCKNASTCTYPRAPDRPVTSCCEHDGYEECEGLVSLALLRAGNIFSQSTGSMAASLKGERDSGLNKGLCKNCANLETCTFQKPEGGVWHCDEYR